MRRRGPTPALRQRVYVPERLRAALHHGLESGLVLIQAPAGCGKTAVALQFLLDDGIDPHWLTCSADDASPAALLTGLVRALDGAESQGGRTALAAIPGVGPWTVEYVAMRALGDPDGYPAADIALINALGRKGETLEHLKPWRAYAAVRLWRRAARKGIRT